MLNDPAIGKRLKSVVASIEPEFEDHQEGSEQLAKIIAEMKNNLTEKWQSIEKGEGGETPDGQEAKEQPQDAGPISDQTVVMDIPWGDLKAIAMKPDFTETKMFVSKPFNVKS